MRQKRLGGLFAAAVFLLCAVMTGTYLIADMAHIWTGHGFRAGAGKPSGRRGHADFRHMGVFHGGACCFHPTAFFTPLMALFPHDWRLVRTLGCLILQGGAGERVFLRAALGADKSLRCCSQG